MNVLIVDDHPIIHQILGAAVKKAMPNAIVHLRADLAGAIECARRLKKLELVLLDLGLPGCAGIDALLRFRKIFGHIRVAVITGTEDQACIRDSLAAGAVGFLPKTSRPSVIVAAIRLIVDGGTYVPLQAVADPGELHSTAQKRRGGDSAAGIQLTGRQADVLHLLTRGLANRQIAERLDISENTVKQHAHAVFRTLGVASRAEAIVTVSRLGLKLG